MSQTLGDAAIYQRQQEQMLKLVTKSFYNELLNYGVKAGDIVKVSAHLLEHLMHKQQGPGSSGSYYNKEFSLAHIRDEWHSQQRLALGDIQLSPLTPELYPQVARWLQNPAIKYNFISLFPESEDALVAYFQEANRDYFTIFCQGEPVGLIGADTFDPCCQKLEMRKFVGTERLQGQGIGKRATFVFLYYAFEVKGVNKVYIHSADVNIHNLNLNSKFGFELEGVFFEDVMLKGTLLDVVRMGLLRERWRAIFAE